MNTVDIELRLPQHTLEFLDNVCTQSHQSRDTVVNVLLAADLLRCDLSSPRDVTEAHPQSRRVPPLPGPVTVSAKQDAAPQPDEAKHPDPETVAFITIGATQAWMDAGDNADAALFDGFMYYVNECIRWAEELDVAFASIIEAGDLTQVFAYEIAEPFGYQYGAALIERCVHRDDVAARQVIAKLLREARDEAAPKPTASEAAKPAAASPKPSLKEPDVQTSKPITPDVYLCDAHDTLVVSYGPRRLAKDNCIDPCHESEAQFWGMYEHHLDTGEAKIMFDVVTKDDAVRAADLFAHMINRNHEMQWQVEASTATARNKVARIVELESDVSRLNDEVLAKQREADEQASRAEGWKALALDDRERMGHQIDAVRKQWVDAEQTLRAIQETINRVRR